MPKSPCGGGQRRNILTFFIPQRRLIFIAELDAEIVLRINAALINRVIQYISVHFGVVKLIASVGGEYYEFRSVVI